VRYLLDTDTLSQLLRRAPSPVLLRRIALTLPDDQATTSITLGELLYGAQRLGDRGTPLAERIERELLSNLAVLPFDRAAARAYSSIRVDLERRGTPIGDADMRIAAIAHARGLVVVTHNMRHFARVPALAVEDWLD